jgi:hypothetical protein
MVLDCGGGTVDITMHRVADKTPSMLLEEICPPSGGPWGSTYVDAEFEAFVEKLVGTAVFKDFKPSSGWVDLMKNWEAAKLSFTSDDLSGEDYKAVNISGVMDVST